MKGFADLETYCMGTNVIQRVYGERFIGAGVTHQASEELKRLENMLSFYKADSEVSLVNKSAGQEYVPLSKDTLYIIRKAKEYAEICGGTFDITAAPLIELWGVFTKNQRVPANGEINNAKALIDYKDILINESFSSVKLLRKGQKIDLGGIAKGFAADKVAEIYRDNGVESAFINIGGNVLVLGIKPDGSYWNIGIQNPLEPRGDCIGAVIAANKTVVTSGDYVRYFEKDNIKYHHILDPRTGYPSASGIMSVTIITESSIDADALSTAAFILGLEEGMKFIESINFADAIFITKDKKVYTTEGVKDNFIFAGEEKGFEYIK